jgi:hypothetical protein
VALPEAGGSHAMGKFTVTHEIHCNDDTFWKVFFDRDFNTKLFLDNLHFPEYSILEQRETDREIVRKVSGMPKLDMPGPVLKILGPGFKYVEEGTFDKATKRWRFQMTPNVLPGKLRNTGTMRIEPIGEGRVRRIADIEVEAKIFGVGGLIESSGEKQMRLGWDSSAIFMNRWLKEHPNG